MQTRYAAKNADRILEFHELWSAKPIMYRNIKMNRPAEGLACQGSLFFFCIFESTFILIHFHTKKNSKLQLLRSSKSLSVSFFFCYRFSKLIKKKLYENMILFHFISIQKFFFANANRIIFNVKRNKTKIKLINFCMQQKRVSGTLSSV